MINLLSCAAFSCSKNGERENQDAIMLPRQSEGAFVFAVADGVGSYNGAGEAARIAVKQLAALTETELLNPQITLDLIKKRIGELSDTSNDYFKAATTLSYCLLTDEGLNIIHIGDTRVYVKKGGKLILLTKDHTQHQELLDDGLYTKKELEGLSGKNTLTAALTRSLEIRYQHVVLPFADVVEDDGVLTLFIMSDGAHHFWERRPRFSINTLNNVNSFSASLFKRVQRQTPSDDYSLIAAQFKVR
ncbi:PP2C family protein-serine/threonine phosphatase [Dickeya zeae]|uniref:PP2C family protein-serine/threonine phosphatase n=1 Tax=Dickeya zeae TaxID=204042 RepID=UPI00036997E9|nr:protein phosphatase 2C domain-containing protein [Dickeya zeae]UJR53906.1 serine/threonine-protein phosphatase [Dickeya zeae MS1]